MNWKNKYHNVRKTAVGGILGAAACLPSWAWAGLPTAASVADGASTTSPLQTTRDMVTRGMTIGATVVAAAIVLGGMWQIYSSYVKAREKGDWKDLGITSAVGVGMMAGGVVISILALQYGTL